MSPCSPCSSITHSHPISLSAPVPLLLPLPFNGSSYLPPNTRTTPAPGSNSRQPWPGSAAALLAVTRSLMLLGSLGCPIKAQAQKQTRQMGVEPRPSASHPAPRLLYNTYRPLQPAVTWYQKLQPSIQCVSSSHLHGCDVVLCCMCGFPEGL